VDIKPKANVPRGPRPGTCGEFKAWRKGQCVDVREAASPL
jgi:hypothetical protein